VLHQEHLLLYATTENTYHYLAEIGHLSLRKKNPVRQPGEIKHVQKEKIASRHNDDCNAHPCYKALLCVKDIDGHQK